MRENVLCRVFENLEAKMNTGAHINFAGVNSFSLEVLFPLYVWPGDLEAQVEF